MKKLTIFAASILALAQLHAAPTKYVDVDVNWQQMQDLEELHIQQGASMEIRVRPKLDRKWLTLTGLTARWEAREQMTNTSAYSASSSITSNEAHWIQVDLSNTQTGTSYTNWWYSLILIDGSDEYPIGRGKVHVWPSDFAGSSATLVGSGYETNGVTASGVSTVNFGSGVTSSLVSNKLTLSVAGTSDTIAITNIVDGAYIEATRSGRDVTLSVTGLTSGASVNTNTIAERAWVEGKGYLTSYTETDPVWVEASNSFARTSGFQMLGNINLNAFTLDNGIVDADQLTTGTVPLSALSSITTNQMQGATHALYVADTDTDTTYTAGTGIALAGGEFSASGVSTNEMAAATVAQIHAATAAGLTWSTNSINGTNTVSVDVGTNTYHLDLSPTGVLGGLNDLSDLGDVADLSGAAADEVLAYNGATWTNAAASGGGASYSPPGSNQWTCATLPSDQNNVTYDAGASGGYEINPIPLSATASQDPWGVVNSTTDKIAIGMLPGFSTNVVYRVDMTMRLTDCGIGNARYHLNADTTGGLALLTARAGGRHDVSDYQTHNAWGLYRGISTNFLVWFKFDTYDSGNTVDVRSGYTKILITPIGLAQ